MARPRVEEQRKSEILTATCAVIAGRGINIMRVADVARQAGLSPGIIHYYFDNKRDLIRAAFESNFEESLQRRSEIIASDTDPSTKLRNLVDSYLPEGDATVEAWHVWVELWTGALHDTDLQDLNDRAYGEWRRIVAGIIRDGQASKDFIAGDPVEIADVIVGTLDGLSLQILVGSHAMTLVRMRRSCQILIDQLVQPSAPASDSTVPKEDVRGPHRVH